MIHLVLVLVCVLGIETFYRYEFISKVKNVIYISRKIVTMLAHGHISDHWKEKMIPYYAFLVMRYSSIILIGILIICLPAIVLSFYYPTLIPHIISLYGMLEVCLISVLYASARAHIIK